MRTDTSVQEIGTRFGETELPWIEEAGKVAPQDARSLTKLFLTALSTHEEGTREYQYARNTLIEMNESLVQFVARRFRNRGGGGMEDIHQVGVIGLIKAIDRFELSREVEFTSFAVPYISGEIKRHFRDTTWSVHVPRRLQELRADLGRAREALSGSADGEPSVARLAAYLNLTEEEVREGIVATNAYTTESLDLPTTTGDDATATYGDFVGAPDPGMGLVEDLHTLAPLLAELDERERAILEMRFGQELTQSQIGESLGISQMHVSRLLSRTLTRLRDRMLADE